MLTDLQKKRSVTLLSTLLPEVRVLAEKHLESCNGLGIDLLVIQALRTKQEQDAIYAQGRAAPGSIVTNARFGYSWHNFGRAYDVAVVEGGEIIWASPKYLEAGRAGKSLGLVWGGDFKKVKGDLGHFEYHPGLTLAQARAEKTTSVGKTT